MPRANKGPHLVLYGPDNRFGASVRLGFSRYLWYIAWYEQGRRREHGAGVAHGGDAEGAFRAWLTSRAAAQRPAGSRSDPSEMTVSQALHWYGLEHAPNTRAMANRLFNPGARPSTRPGAAAEGNGKGDMSATGRRRGDPSPLPGRNSERRTRRHGAVSKMAI